MQTCADKGERGQKMAKFVRTSFMDGPLLFIQNETVRFLLFFYFL